MGFGRGAGSRRKTTPKSGVAQSVTAEVNRTSVTGKVRSPVNGGVSRGTWVYMNSYSTGLTDFYKMDLSLPSREDTRSGPPLHSPLLSV